MKKTIIWVLVALVSGGLLGKFTIDRYEKVEITPVMKVDNDVYALYYGSYSNTDEMSEDIVDIDKYIYIEQNNNVYVYLALAKTNSNAKKFKKIYESKNMDVSVVKITINNEEFIQNLNEYEKLLSATDDENSLMIIENQILSCYTDLVVGHE